MSLITAACPAHAGLTRFGQMIHTVAEARASVDEIVSYIRRHDLPPGFLVLQVMNGGPPCCPSAGLARHVMSAAWRERLAGEGEPVIFPARGTGVS